MDNIFAYETNGLGSRYVMDDANVPVCPHFIAHSVYIWLRRAHPNIVIVIATLPWFLEYVPNEGLHFDKTHVHIARQTRQTQHT